MALWSVLAMVFGALALCSCHPDRPTDRPPRFPDQFTLRTEAINNTGRQISSTLETFDYISEFSRRDFVPGTSRWHRHFQKYGRHPLVIINDYKSGHEYIIDKWNGNCTTTNISRYDRYADFNGTNVVHVKHAFDFFRNRNFTYTDKVLIRNIPVEKWESRSNNSKFEFYFLRPDWSSMSEESMNATEDIPVAMNFTHYNGTNVSYYHLIHIYDFHSGHSEQNMLPAVACHQQFLRVEFRINGDFSRGTFYIWEVRLAITRYLAKVSNVTVMRINNLQILEVHGSTMTAEKKLIGANVQFQLVEVTPPGNIQDYKMGITMEQAYQNLEKAVDTEMTETVTLPNGNRMSFTVVKSSLRKYSESPDVYTSSLTPGQVAAIVIVVAIVTFALGFLVAFLLRKRFPVAKGVPYEITQ